MSQELQDLELDYFKTQAMVLGNRNRSLKANVNVQERYIEILETQLRALDPAKARETTLRLRLLTLREEWKIRG
jgi:hypothetical protein|tara:strand:- start:335 stop:556 length:222 start_codon:yes stop_codon:yes gene_type:complete